MAEELIKIVAIEDNDFDYELIERRIQKMNFRYALRRVLNEAELRLILEEFTPDLVLSDFSVPSFSGLQGLKIIKGLNPSIPFIFVSGTIGEEMAVETLKEGADDYVLKDNLSKLEPAILRALAEAKEKARRIEAEKLLKVKNQELRTLIYRISHDFRSPVASIKGAVDLALRYNKTGDIEESIMYFDIINKVVDKLEGVITNINSFQFIYGDELKKENIEVKELISELEIPLSKVEGINSLDIQISVSGKESFYCEKHLVFSLLFNLLNNAVVFSDKGKAKKYVHCNIAVYDSEIDVVVEDNGVGIPYKIQEKVFDMFFRGSNLSRGAGLGLYLVKMILERLGGKVVMESKEGVGTKFSVKFQLKNAEKDLAGQTMPAKANN